MITIIASRRASLDDGECPVCMHPFGHGQRLVLIRDGDHHHWIHVGHILRAGKDGDVASEDQAAPGAPR